MLIFLVLAIIFAMTDSIWSIFSLDKLIIFSPHTRLFRIILDPAWYGRQMVQNYWLHVQPEKKEDCVSFPFREQSSHKT